MDTLKTPIPTPTEASKINTAYMLLHLQPIHVRFLIDSARIYLMEKNRAKGERDAAERVHPFSQVRVGLTNLLFEGNDAQVAVPTTTEYVDAAQHLIENDTVSANTFHEYAKQIANRL